MTVGLTFSSSNAENAAEQQMFAYLQYVSYCE